MRGGKRKGAGRKPRSVPRQAITVLLEPDDAARFRAICKSSGRSQSEQIAHWSRPVPVGESPLKAPNSDIYKDWPSG